MLKNICLKFVAVVSVAQLVDLPINIRRNELQNQHTMDVVCLRICKPLRMDNKLVCVLFY